VKQTLPSLKLPRSSDIATITRLRTWRSINPALSNELRHNNLAGATWMAFENLAGTCAET